MAKGLLVFSGAACFPAGIREGDMNLSNQNVRWRGTVLAGASGSPALLMDDWCLATEDGAVLARVFRSRMRSDHYFAALCLGRSSVAGDITFKSLPSRQMAMEACEHRLARIATVLNA